MQKLTGMLVLGAAAIFAAWPALGDTVLLENVNGYTLDGSRELVRFSALQFTDGEVDRTFGADDVLPESVDQRVDGAGGTVIPGLIDAHGHVYSHGRALLSVILTEAASEQEAAQRVANFAEENPEVEWIQGRGWNQVLWESNEFPSAASLDAVVSDRPVWLGRVDGHAAWANSLAMELAGVTARSEDPEGGQIMRDAEGIPTGVFVDTAMGLVSGIIPEPGREEIKRALSVSMQDLAGWGLTSVHDAGSGSTVIASFRELLEAGEMPVRVNLMLAASDEFYEERLAEGRFRDENDFLAMHSVKVVGDGALGSRGAALLEEYSDDPGNTGLLRYNDEQLQYLMRAAMNADFQVNTHAIGDAANQIVLDSYEMLIRETGSRDLRHRVEHAQVLTFDDIQRFAELGVVPSMQATHATSDKNMAEDRLGSVRIQGAYAWRKLLDTGVKIANGSDFPVEHPNPFYGLHASVTRQDQRNEPDGGWYPEENMTLEEAFASFTIDAAWAGHQEEILGTLEPGKKADFLLLDRDLFDIPASEIWQIQVLETWVNGERVFSRAGEARLAQPTKSTAFRGPNDLPRMARPGTIEAE